MTWRQGILRLFIVGLTAFAVGAIDSLIKGQGTGLLGALSEVIVPWLLLAFLAGAMVRDRRYAFAAIVGVTATMAALIGFYFVNCFIFSYWDTTWVAALYNQMVGGHIYFELGLFSGALCGSFGAWWKQHLSMVPVVVLGVAFVVEAVVRALLTGQIFGYAHQVGEIEFFVGTLWLVFALVATLALRHRQGLRQAT
jgi:hypothetical protein